MIFRFVLITLFFLSFSLASYSTWEICPNCPAHSVVCPDLPLLDLIGEECTVLNQICFHSDSSFKFICNTASSGGGSSGGGSSGGSTTGPSLAGQELRITHDFSTVDSGSMFLALLNPSGDVIKVDSVPLSTSSLEEMDSYAELDFSQASDKSDVCNYGFGDYTFLVHLKPYQGAQPYTIENLLYHCYSLEDLLNQVKIPSSWEAEDLMIYCSFSRSPFGDYFDFFSGIGFFEAMDLGCIIKNVEEDQALFYGYGNPTDNTLEWDHSLFSYDKVTDEFRIKSLLKISTDYNTNANCIGGGNNLICDYNSNTYEYSYNPSSSLAYFYNQGAGELTTSLSSVFNYRPYIENDNTNSLFINNNFDDDKLIVAYDIPNVFLQETIPRNSITRTINDVTTPLFRNLAYIIMYENFDIAQKDQNIFVNNLCINNLRSFFVQNVSQDFDKISIINSTNTPYLTSEVELLCFSREDGGEDYLIINEDIYSDLELKALVKNLILGAQENLVNSYDNTLEGLFNAFDSVEERVAGSTGDSNSGGTRGNSGGSSCSGSGTQRC